MEQNYSGIHTNIRQAIGVLLTFEDKREGFAGALHEISLAERHIPNEDKKGKEIIEKINAMIDKTKKNPEKGSWWQNINEMSEEEKYKLSHLVLDLYDHVSEKWYNFKTGQSKHPKG